MANKIQSSFERYEKKYMLTPAQYDALRLSFAPHLRADEYGRYSICSLYYDTPDYRLIRASLSKPVYKEKLRLRSYGVPGSADPVFVELKKKFQGEVFKRRVVMDASSAARYLADGYRPVRKDAREEQICREIDWFRRSYNPAPAALIAYEREAYAGTENPALRVTFDQNIRWRASELDLRAGDQGEALLPGGHILMEVKIPGAAPLWLARALSENRVYPASFSKYGVCYSEHLMRPKAEKPQGKAVRFCA